MPASEVRLVSPFIGGGSGFALVAGLRYIVEISAARSRLTSFIACRGTSLMALECAMDELAEKLDLDPIELRMRNEPTEDPPG